MQGQTSPWCGRRVLVTGCTGFLGAAVTRELLDRQAHVIGLLPEKKSAAQFAPEQEDGLFHLVHGRTDDVARVYTTVAIHEVSAILHVAHDSDELETSPRGNNRISAEVGVNAVMRAAALYHTRLPVIVARNSSQLRLLGTDKLLPHGIARFDELFGPGDRSMERVVPRTISALLEGERNHSLNSSSRDFVFVRDAAQACLALAEAVAAGSNPLDVTFRSGWELTETEIARVIADIYAGRKPEVTEVATPANPIGWHAAMSLTKGLGDTIEWYRREYLRRSSATHPADHLRKAA